MVLVVEDEAALGAAVAESLADAGFVVDRAGDGEEALARVRGRAYDLIICDLKMPRVDGMTFYRQLGERRARLARRILFVTGDVAGTEAERFLEETGCRWLAKPFRLKDLLRTGQRDPRSVIAHLSARVRRSARHARPRSTRRDRLGAASRGAL